MPDECNKDEKLPLADRPSIADKDLDYAKEFWTVGNVITGFSIVQTLWFFTVVAPGHESLSIALSTKTPLAGGAALGLAILYLFGIGFAHSAHYKIIDRYISPESFRRDLLKFWIIRYAIVLLTGGVIAYTCFTFKLMAVSCCE